MIPFSVLDLSPIPAGADASDALRNTLALARHAEAFGFHRFWLAEHHNMPGIASAATAVVIGHVAAGTRTIRVGSGGIMLPNHAPLVIAEQFGTLAALHPGRIDLGLGRAPGSDGATTRALRRDPMAAESFPRDVVELQHWFAPADPRQAVQAVPGAGLDVPIILLGSSLFSAQIAAMLGLPFAFAAHFAPDALGAALDIYRSRFEPSATLSRPHAIVGLAVYAADTDAEARRLSTSHQQQFLALRRGTPGKLPAPVDDMEPLWSPAERAMVEHAMSEAIIGGPARIRAGLEAILRRTQADELIIAAQIHDHAARERSYTLVAEARAAIAASRATTVAA